MNTSVVIRVCVFYCRGIFYHKEMDFERHIKFRLLFCLFYLFSMFQSCDRGFSSVGEVGDVLKIREQCSSPALKTEKIPLMVCHRPDRRTSGRDEII